MLDLIRKLIWRVVGYPRYIQHIIQAIKENDGRVMMYPMGEFNLEVQTDQGEMEPIVFLTPQERAAFVAGLHHGAYAAGGQSRMMAEGEDDMDELANTPGDPRKVN